MQRVDFLSYLRLAIPLFLFAAEGLQAEVNIASSEIKGVRGCTMEYEVYEPRVPAADSVVILAHGFMRDLTTMRGWADDWSARGVQVVIPSLCNSSWISGRHEKNAEDLLALRRQLGIGSVVYAGFSAGGLAAYLAALDDPNTAAYLGLDSVDSGGLAAEAGRELKAPTLFLFGESSRCNARQNFMKVIRQWDSYEYRQVEGASHCHFERPYDKRCGWVCGRGGDSSVGEYQEEIALQATTWLMKILGENQEADAQQ